MGVTDTGFLSCAAIRTGFNFYRSGKVTACCHGIDPALEIARVDDPALPQRILAFQSAFGKLHRQGAAPAVCHRCTNFQRDSGPRILGSHLRSSRSTITGPAICAASTAATGETTSRSAIRRMSLC